MVMFAVKFGAGLPTYIASPLLTIKSLKNSFPLFACQTKEELIFILTINNIAVFDTEPEKFGRPYATHIGSF